MRDVGNMRGRSAGDAGGRTGRERDTKGSAGEKEGFVARRRGRGILSVLRSSVLCLSVLCPVLLAGGAALASGSFAPLSPAYRAYLASSKNGAAASRGGVVSSGGAATRAVPLDLSHLRGTSSAVSTAFPVSYDLRALGKVSPIRNQKSSDDKTYGTFGTCWTFATFASLESVFRPAESRDFSEYHLAYCGYTPLGGNPSFTRHATGSGENPIFGQGGHMVQSSALLARWTEPVDETACPYDRTGKSVPTGLEPVVAHVQNILYLTDDNQGFSSVSENDLKSLLTTRGAVAVLMEWWGSEEGTASGDAYSADQCSYYNGNVKEGAEGHFVTIVGWNDDFSASRFNVNPLTDGAWLVRNSWGGAWGDGGYFWVSYRDPMFRMSTAVYLGESTSNYSRNYQYDPLGWVNGYGFASETGYFANVFTASADESVAAVSFYAGAAGATYEISVYTGAAKGPTSGTRALSGQTGTLTAAGYYTIPLSSAVAVTKGQKFSVVVKLTTPGYDYPIPVEYAQAGYSESADAAPGQSFVGADGKDWTDGVSLDSTLNVCLKAFAGTGATPTVTPTAAPSSGSGGCQVLAFGSAGLILLPLLSLALRRNRRS
jgi:C1A family cysteine protease